MRPHTSAARPLLWPLVPIYRLGLALRELQLRTGLKRVRRLKWPVVSIGNLSAGGAGKTPLTIALAKALTARGVQVDVLSRGYGRRKSALPLLVDPAAQRKNSATSHSSLRARRKFPSMSQQNAMTRASRGTAPKAPQDANRSLVPKAHILDDGFQHRQLARYIDILLLSRRDLADRLCYLRAIFASRCAQRARDGDRHSGRRTRCGNRNRSARLEGSGLAHSSPHGNPATGRPRCRLLRHCAARSVFSRARIRRPKACRQIAFADHHTYTAADLARIESAARAAGANALLTTEKDRVRIGAFAAAVSASLPIQTVGLRIEIEDEPAAIDWLTHSLRDSV